MTIIFSTFVESKNVMKNLGESEFPTDYGPRLLRRRTNLKESKEQEIVQKVNTTKKNLITSQ